jgi:hypothetical protein
MMLSSILDIGSFFIGMIINLLLVTLMCYYFKKKYESLEEAQNEQAKLLYELLQDRKQDRAPVKPTMIDMQEIEVSDEESDTDEESEMEEIVPSTEPEVKVLTLEIPTETNEPMVIEKTETETDTDLEITLEGSSSDDLSKMSMRQLRDLLTEKGVKVKPSMKKNELVELAKL